MGIGPVVRRAGVIGLFRADEGARLDPGDVSWVEAGPEAVRTLRFDSARRSKVPCSTKSGQSRSYSSRLPSHHSTRSGAVSEEKSSTKRRRPVWVVGAVVMGFFLGCRVVGWAAKLWPTAPSWPQREPVLPAFEGRWTGLRSAGSADRVRRRFATRWTSRTRTRAMAGLALSGHGQATVDGGLGAFATRRGPGFRSS